MWYTIGFGEKTLKTTRAQGFLIWGWHFWRCCDLDWEGHHLSIASRGCEVWTFSSRERHNFRSLAGITAISMHVPNTRHDFFSSSFQGQQRSGKSCSPNPGHVSPFFPMARDGSVMNCDGLWISSGSFSSPKLWHDARYGWRTSAGATSVTLGTDWLLDIIWLVECN